MAKKIFEKGDKVFDIIFGWGKVTEVYYPQDRDYPVSVQFENSVIIYTYDGKWAHGDSYSRLSFKEYGFDNRFSQERPIDYKEYIGKWGKFWNNYIEKFIITTLDDYFMNDNKPFETNCGFFKHFEPLTDEQIKVLGLM